MQSFDYVDRFSLPKPSSPAGVLLGNKQAQSFFIRSIACERLLASNPVPGTTHVLQDRTVLIVSLEPDGSIKILEGDCIKTIRALPKFTTPQPKDFYRQDRQDSHENSIFGRRRRAELPRFSHEGEEQR